MDYFRYKNGKLYAESVDIDLITGDVGTPAYIYSQATLADHLKKIQHAYAQLEPMVCFSVKACANINILRFLASQDCGFDVVSGGELYRVLQAGGDPKKVVYAGVGKTDKEILEALNAGIAYFNIESEAELDNLVRLAETHGKHTKVALRVNPDVDYQTHKYITTGKKENKFGIAIERARAVFTKYQGDSHVRLCALHVHLGSGGKTIDPYVEAVKKILPLVDELRDQGHAIEALDLGGGYGADYETGSVPSAADYAQGLVPLLRGKQLRLILEPGKSISANAGILVTRVLYTKQNGNKRFVIVDAGMNDLIRPALYQAFHFIWPTQVAEAFTPVRRSQRILCPGTEQVDVVGPICESGDFLAKDRALPPVQRGDLLAIFSAGAYGFTMSSNYNSRGRLPEVLVDGDKHQVIRRRESYKDLVALEHVRSRI